MNVRKEIDEHAKEEDKAVLHWLFDHYHTSSTWPFVARCEHKRYGYRSYETHRVWSPTKEGLAIYRQLS